MKKRILIVDDDISIINILSLILEKFGCCVTTAANGKEALGLLTRNFDTIILDINMPELDGISLLRIIKTMGIDTPVLFLTGEKALENAKNAIELGAYDFIEKPIEDFEFFKLKIDRSLQKNNLIRKEKKHREDLEKEVKNKTMELENTNKILLQYSKRLEDSTIETISTLMVALEEKDRMTIGHTNRVTHYAKLLAQKNGLPARDCQAVARASQLHDIGKLVIDSSYIHKVGPLTDNEWNAIKKHPETGAAILAPLGFLQREKKIVHQHHEWFDGTGYPDGIKGMEIDLLARIVTIADSYDAMTSPRSYKEAIGRAEAIQELERCAGTQFDPSLTESFIEIIKKEL